MSRIYLSPPHLSGEEIEFLQETVASNWIAPLGPQVDAFEREFADAVQVPHAAALSSGTAALHLALELIGVGSGDEVICPTLTFAATANAVVYCRAEPVFLDSEKASWNLDPDLLEEELREAAARGQLPKAVISVDLYGQSADYERIVALCTEYEVPLIEDAAEALGASYQDRPCGGFGRFGVFSFNGNKIITTSGGGMLVSSDGAAIERARFLASQARDPAPHYEHSTIGYNYRLSNLLAAVGRAQLRVLPDRVKARRHNFEHYQELLGDLPGIEFMPEPTTSRSSRWLTCLTIDAEALGTDREALRLALGEADIEARPVWKPMHLQPVFQGKTRIRGGGVSEDLFARGLCLPSGSSLSSTDRQRIAEIIHRQVA